MVSTPHSISVSSSASAPLRTRCGEAEGAADESRWGKSSSMPPFFRASIRIGFFFSTDFNVYMKTNLQKTSSAEESSEQVDLAILRVLRDDSRKTLQEIGAMVGLSCFGSVAMACATGYGGAACPTPGRMAAPWECRSPADTLAFQATRSASWRQGDRSVPWL